MAIERKKAAAKSSAAPKKKAAAWTPKAPANKTAALPRKAAPSTHPSLAPEIRHRRIAEAAYYIALKKGFEKSEPLKNWLEAEKEVDG